MMKPRERLTKIKMFDLQRLSPIQPDRLRLTLACAIESETELKIYEAYERMSNACSFIRASECR